MREVTITEARGSLSALVDQAHEAPVFLTRRNRAVAAIDDVEQLERLRADADELADIRAVDAAWQKTEELQSDTSNILDSVLLMAMPKANHVSFGMVG